MSYTAKEINEFNDLVKQVIKTGVIKKEDKKKIEQVLEYITGQKWSNRCVGCSMPQVSRILKAHHEKLLKEELATSTIPTSKEWNKMDKGNEYIVPKDILLNMDNVTGTTLNEQGKAVDTPGKIVDGKFIPNIKIEKKRGRKPNNNNNNNNDKPEEL